MEPSLTPAPGPPVDDQAYDQYANNYTLGVPSPRPVNEGGDGSAHSHAANPPPQDVQMDYLNLFNNYVVPEDLLPPFSYPPSRPDIQQLLNQVSIINLNYERLANTVEETAMNVNNLTVKFDDFVSRFTAAQGTTPATPVIQFPYDVRVKKFYNFRLHNDQSPFVPKTPSRKLGPTV